MVSHVRQPHLQNECNGPAAKMHENCARRVRCGAVQLDNVCQVPAVNNAHCDTTRHNTACSSGTRLPCYARCCSAVLHSLLHCSPLCCTPRAATARCCCRKQAVQESRQLRRAAARSEASRCQGRAQATRARVWDVSFFLVSFIISSIVTCVAAIAQLQP